MRGIAWFRDLEDLGIAWFLSRCSVTSRCSKDWRPLLLGARTLLAATKGAPGPTTSKRTLLGAKGIATSNKCLTISNKKLIETISKYNLIEMEASRRSKAHFMLMLQHRNYCGRHLGVKRWPPLVPTSFLVTTSKARSP